MLCSFSDLSYKQKVGKLDFSPLSVFDQKIKDQILKRRRALCRERIVKRMNFMGDFKILKTFKIIKFQKYYDSVQRP